MIEGPPTNNLETTANSRRLSDGRANPLVAIPESVTTETSVELLREFERTGDAAPFEAFMRRHAAMVYATCLKVTRDPHDAEDATQATFLTLASKSRLNGEIRQPEAWLRKVAHRLSLDLIRSKKRRINRENLRSEMTSEEAPLDSSDFAGNSEMKGILNEELAKLPASYRMPLVLHYFGGLSREEMASQLKIKPSTLGVRLHRAREQLRKRLSTRGIALPTVALAALLTEVVRHSICSHLLSRTAQHASAIALGHAPAISATAGIPSLRVVTDLVAGSKLRMLLSSFVIGSAISISSAQVRQLIPQFIRDLMPSLHAPTLPKFDFKISPPRLVASAAEESESIPVGASVAIDAERVRVVSDFSPKSVVVSQKPMPVAQRTFVPIPASTMHLASSSSAGLVRITTPVDSEVRPPVAVRTIPTAPRPLPVAPAPSASQPKVDEVPVAAASDAPHQDSWNSVIPSSGNKTSGAPRVPLASADSQDVPEAITAAVVGTIPEVASSGGGGGAAASRGAAPATASAASLDVPMKSVQASRTATFAGTSANYGGFADASWTPTQLSDLSASLSEVPVAAMSFSVPTVPTDPDALSVNGARVTLRNAVGSDPVTISFVDTSSTAIPALPEKHHFIGVWELDTATTFEAIDLLVRYDDLRAARLGLNEQILKLWVSDGETWTLLWKDPSFGRDIYQNLLWVTAGEDVKFFAVSAPEPTTLLAMAAGVIGLASRRRR